MSRSTRKACLPLRVSAVSTHVIQWLRNAGIPAVALQQLQLEEDRDLAGVTVLYDSRSAASRADVETINNAQTNLIDVAPLLTTDQADQPTILENEIDQQLAAPRFLADNFLVRLKKEIESRGGLWIRLADYPFPYQSAVCIGEWPQAELEPVTRQSFSPLPTSEGTSSELNISQQKYAAGMPFYFPVSDQHEQVSETEAMSEDFPLLWKTTFPEFIRWRKIRLQATFQVELENGRYRFNSETNFDHFRPMLELWRGTYLASFRLLNTNQKVREEGLAFQQARSRHPGGFPAHHLQGQHRIETSELVSTANSSE